VIKPTYEELEARLAESVKLGGVVARAAQRYKAKAARAEAKSDELARRLRLALYGQED
jgi:hypothetical protein